MMKELYITKNDNFNFIRYGTHRFKSIEDIHVEIFTDNI